MPADLAPGREPRTVHRSHPHGQDQQPGSQGKARPGARQGRNGQGLGREESCQAAHRVSMVHLSRGGRPGQRHPPRGARAGRGPVEPECNRRVRRDRWPGQRGQQRVGPPSGGTRTSSPNWQPPAAMPHSRAGSTKSKGGWPMPTRNLRRSERRTARVGPKPPAGRAGVRDRFPWGGFAGTGPCGLAAGECRDDPAHPVRPAAASRIAARTRLLPGGRAAGKTRSAPERVRHRAESRPACGIGRVAPVSASGPPTRPRSEPHHRCNRHNRPEQAAKNCHEVPPGANSRTRAVRIVRWLGWASTIVPNALAKRVTGDGGIGRSQEGARAGMTTAPAGPSRRTALTCLAGGPDLCPGRRYIMGGRRRRSGSAAGRSGGETLARPDGPRWSSGNRYSWIGTIP